MTKWDQNFPNQVSLFISEFETVLCEFFQIDISKIFEMLGHSLHQSFWKL